MLKIKSVQDLNIIIPLANTKLMDIFGMQLVKLAKFSKKGVPVPPTQSIQTLGTQTPSQAGKDAAFSADSIYILQNVLPDSYRACIMEDSVENRETGYMGVVSIVVSILAFSGGSLEGPALTRHLGALDLDQKLKMTSLHSVEDVLKSMVKQMYIEKETRTVEGEQNQQFIRYHLGRRASREFTKEGLVELCQKIMKDRYTESTNVQLLSQFKHTDILSVSEIPSISSGQEAPNISRPEESTIDL